MSTRQFDIHLVDMTCIGRSLPTEQVLVYKKHAKVRKEIEPVKDLI
jgi:hypothetical protein